MEEADRKKCSNNETISFFSFSSLPASPVIKRVLNQHLKEVAEWEKSGENVAKEVGKINSN